MAQFRFAETYRADGDRVVRRGDDPRRHLVAVFDGDYQIEVEGEQILIYAARPAAHCRYPQGSIPPASRRGALAQSYFDAGYSQTVRNNLPRTR